MGYKREQLQPAKEPIYDFTNTTTPVEGTIFLQLSLGERDGTISRMVEFMVVKIDFVFNTIIGRLGLHAFKVVPLIYHQCL